MQIKNGLPEHVGAKVASALHEAVQRSHQIGLDAHVSYAVNHHFAEVRIQRSGIWICVLALPLSLDEEHMTARILEALPATSLGR